MIKLEKVEKYYNRGKSNQIHVIDNTSMTLPDRGIVCLLGPSGCGKTTLLNAMGGLDKVDLGRIEIDNDRITNCSANKIDTVRNAKIGYIFQNFNLLDDRTVYENVAIALRMVGVTGEKTIRERVNYCLEQVGIYQFRNRKAAALSGGQRQRVAIARAIVKNPRIIIADEPTGNLDSVNSLEIMNIIKKISAARLVVLVTHERKLAEFYSDHIAEIQDGKIVRAYNNDSSKYLDYQLENRIYLKDMPVEKDFCVSDIAVRYFSEDERPVDIKLVVKGSNLYIDTGGKLNVVDETSNIELIDDHYKAMDTSIYEDNDFRYDAYLPENFKARYRSVYGFGNMFVNGWKNLIGFKKFKKFLLVGFVFAAMFAFLAVSNTFGIFDVQPKDYRTTNGNYVTISNPNRTKEAMDVVESLDAVDYVIPGNTRKSVTLPLDDYLQTSYATASMEVSIAHSASLTNNDLICGNLPEDKHGVVLDRLVAEKVMKDTNAKEVGLSSVEKFVGRKIKISNLDDYVISGISDTVSPSMFVDESQVMNILTNADDEGSDFQFAESDEDEDPIRSGKVKDIALSKSKITMKKGSKPTKKFEVIISNQHSYDYKLGSTIKPKMGGHKLKIVGFYESNVYGEDTYYVTSKTISTDYISKQKVFTAYAPNVVALQSMLETKGITSRINDDRDRNNYINSMKSALKSSLLVAAVLLLISLIEMFLMLRSSFLARIKEVGILRAIGLKKREIYKMFAGEILVITVVTAIPGILLMYFLLGNIVKITDYLAGMYMITPTIALITLAVVIVFNLIVGLIPVFMTMRKTPAQILARTDI